MKRRSFLKFLGVSIVTPKVFFEVLSGADKPLLLKKKSPSKGFLHGTFHKIRFHKKQDVFDMDEILVNVNSKMLVFARDTDVIIPGRYLEAVNNTTIEEFKNGKPKTRLMYPFNYISKSSEYEFNKMIGQS